MSDHNTPRITYSAEAGPSQPSASTTSPALPPSPQLASAPSPRLTASSSRLASLLLPGRSRSGSTASVDTAVVDEVEVDSHNGRDTPEQRRRTGRAAASLLASDARYKKFSTQVDRALQSFESVNEWADFISFLSRLLKTLQSPHPPFHELPRKLIVSKRLAQCLNPALPAGVHQRTLEVYAHIFSTIGVEGLRRDLLIWSSGLFPFFQFATTSVRPHLLNIYETFYLPLGSDLRPATKALILALLPGMEEETGDFFERVLALLTHLSTAVNQDFFLHNVLLVLISSASARLAALHYLSRRIVKPPDELQSGLLLRGLAAVLADENVLVRRSGLDLLLRILRMDGELYKTAEDKDKDLLLRSAFDVVLQRDISLSRRVYTWLLGTAESPEQQIQYFRQNGLDAVVTSLQADMDLDPTSPRPFRTFLALMDKWEVGSLLAEKLVIPSLRALHAGVSANGQIQSELSTTANAVYEGVEPIVVWKQLFEMLQTLREEDIKFVSWFAETMTRHEEETVRIDIPAILEYCLSQFEQRRPSGSALLHLAETLLRLIPTSHLKAQSLVEGAKEVKSSAIPHIVHAVFRNSLSASLKDDDHLALLRMASLLVESESPLLGGIDLASWMKSSSQTLGRKSFILLQSIASLLLQIARSSIVEAHTIDESVVEAVMASLLKFLRVDQSAHHVRAVELLWEFKLHAGPYALEDVISQRMKSSDRHSAYEEFSTLWRLTDDAMLPGDIFYTPVFMVLDGMKSGDPTLERIAETWLRVNLGSCTRLLDPILCRLGVKALDISVTTHLVDSLESLLRFGGQAMNKALRTMTEKSPHPLIAAQQGSYASLVVDVLIKLLHSTATGPTRSQLLLRLHASVLGVMQLQVSLGLDGANMDRIQSAIFDKAEAAVQHAELGLQAKMLQLVRATMSESPRQHRKSSSVTTSEKTVDRDGRIIALVRLAIVDPRLVPVLKHWVIFVQSTAQHFASRRDLLEDLGKSLTSALRSQALRLKQAFSTPGTLGLSELEPTMLLDGLERVASLLLPKRAERRSEEGNRNAEGSSILGYMSGVFTVEGPVLELKSDNVQWLDDAVHALLVIWTVSRISPPHCSSQTQITTRLQSRDRAVLEEMYKSQPTAIFGSLVRLWALASAEITDEAIFEAVDTLTSSAQKVVAMVGESVNTKTKGDHSVDPIYTGFLEAYIQRLEAPIAVQVWSTAFGLAKDMLASSTTPVAKAQLYPMLRCLTALGKTVATTSALEDRRLRRDLLETYAKLLDNVMVNLPKLEAGFWERANVTGDVHKVHAYIASEIVPNLRSLLLENDRIAVACSSISTGVLIPAFRHQKVDSSILDIITEMAHLHAGRAWRPLIGDAFNDSRFFRISSGESSQWQPLISALMDTDKDRFLELLSRIQAGPSSNIFINRESEMISRSLNLRRLSFVLLAADPNHYLTQLPSIQEKLVDILRNDVVSPMVHSEVYLCLRVLMTRISAQHMTNFWPVILAELLKVFEGTMDDPPPDGDEGLLLVLAACKFLDLLLLMQSEDFQIHQWMFVTDTTDAAFPLEGYEPEAIMDRLTEILAEHSHVPTKLDVVSWEEQTGPRRPRLNSLKRLTGLHQLQPFFARASIDTFEGVYSGQGVDWDKVEEGLSEEIFDGTN